MYYIKKPEDIIIFACEQVFILGVLAYTNTLTFASAAAVTFFFALVDAA